MNGTSMDFKPPEFIVHFNSKYIESYVAKVNRLNISDLYNAPGVLFRNSAIAGIDNITDLWPQIVPLSPCSNVQCCGQNKVHEKSSKTPAEPLHYLKQIWV